MMPDPAASLPVDQSLLGQILLEQGKTNAQLAAITEQLKALPDHEQRLRALERARWPLPTVTSLAAGAAAVAAWLAVTHR